MLKQIASALITVVLAGILWGLVGVVVNAIPKHDPNPLEGFVVSMLFLVFPPAAAALIVGFASNKWVGAVIGAGLFLAWIIIRPHL